MELNERDGSVRCKDEAVPKRLLQIDNFECEEAEKLENLININLLK